MTSRYTIISADGHAGADLLDYKAYLPSAWHDEFDAWAEAYVNPFADLLAPTRYKNWDSARRLEETESDGIVAEVLFPNTVPPFFDESGLSATPPTAADYDRRWGGLQAHNRWRADCCKEAPGRRGAQPSATKARNSSVVGRARLSACFCSSLLTRPWSHDGYAGWS